MKLRIESTNDSPRVEFDLGNKIFKIEGRSHGVHSGELYAELGNWMIEHVSGLQMEANFDVRLEYYNTVSSIGLSNILEVLERLNKLGNKFSVR